MGLQRMDNVGIVVDDLPATIAFFQELGLELEGQATIDGEWAGRVTGLGDQRVEIAMMRTPDGHGRLELSRFLEPPVVSDHRNAPVNALGYLRIMFTVDEVDAEREQHGHQCPGTPDAVRTLSEAHSRGAARSAAPVGHQQPPIAAMSQATRLEPGELVEPGCRNHRRGEVPAAVVPGEKREAE